jgi:hypothetical protein
MSFDVVKSRISDCECETVLDDERSNEIGNKGGACKLNLPLVPSQGDVLKDNKRCYDNILSECGITDPLQIYYGWLDEHEWS